MRQLCVCPDLKFDCNIPGRSLHTERNGIADMHRNTRLNLGINGAAPELPILELYRSGVGQLVLRYPTYSTNNTYLNWCSFVVMEAQSTLPPQYTRSGKPSGKGTLAYIVVQEGFTRGGPCSWLI